MNTKQEAINEIRKAKESLNDYFQPKLFYLKIEYANDIRDFYYHGYQNGFNKIKGLYLYNDHVDKFTLSSETIENLIK